MSIKQLAKQQYRRRFSELRDLWCQRDPIGVMDQPNWPRDEYDTYVGRSMRMLESNATDDEFTEYLNYIVGEYIGLGKAGIEFSKPSEFVKTMRNWFESNWEGSHL